MKKIIAAFSRLVIKSITLLLLPAMSCSDKLLTPTTGEFISAHYNHFENGILIDDVEVGLDVLWKASFYKGKVYKENLGLIVPGGLLITPNKDNTQNSSKITSLPLALADGRLMVEFRGQYMEVMGIVHTHPNLLGVQSPTPTYDYQYSYLGIHNYILSENYLFDAYKDNKGRETFDQIDVRFAISKFPLTFGMNPALTSILDDRIRKPLFY